MTDPVSSDTHAGPIRTEIRGADTVVASVTIDAPRETVFTAFTDPAVLAEWFWPLRLGTRVECNLRPGGAFGIHADGLPEGQDMGVTGVYQDIDAPVRLTMSWQWTGETAVSQVAIELHDVAGPGPRSWSHIRPTPRRPIATTTCRAGGTA